MSFNNWHFDQFPQEESPIAHYITPDTYQALSPDWYGGCYTQPCRETSPLSSSSSCSNTPEMTPLLYQQPAMLSLSINKADTSTSMVSDISQMEFQQRYQPLSLRPNSSQEVPHSYILQTNCFYMNREMFSRRENEKKSSDSSESMPTDKPKSSKKTNLIPSTKEQKTYSTIKHTKEKSIIREKPKPKSKASTIKISEVTGSYPCTFKNCEKVFLRPYNLKSHMRTHTSERPYSCSYPECEWKFARPHDLKRHQLQHTGLKPYSCKSCSRRFARSDALKRHLKVDTTCAHALSKDK